MSKTLHGELAQAAERDEVSLNAYVNLLLATALHGPALNGAAPPRAAPTAVDESAQPVAPAESAGLHRFLVLALAANVAVTAIVATIAVILLLTA
jgi:HicB family